MECGAVSDILKTFQFDPMQQVADFEKQRGSNENYARATVVRVVGSSASRPGDKFLILEDGELIGFVGGGCIRTAVKRAGLEALSTGQTKLIQVVPKAVADEMDEIPGKDIALNHCPSEGEVELFIEPIIARAPIHVFGRSQLANAVMELGQFAGFPVRHIIEPADFSKTETDGYCVIATCGENDFEAFLAALKSRCPHLLLIASRKKAARLIERAQATVPQERIDQLITPAGLKIGAIGTAEIAIAIIAQVILLYRQAAKGRVSI